MRHCLLLAAIAAYSAILCGSLLADDAKSDDVRTATYPDNKQLLLGPAVTGDVSAVAYAPDGTTYASGNQSGRVSIWDAESGAKLLELPHGGSVYGLAYSRDGRRLASCSGGGATVWNLEDGQPIRSFPWRVDAVSDVEFSLDGKRLYACAWRHWSGDPNIDPATVAEWDVESGELVGRFGQGGHGWEVCLSPDGPRLLVAGNEVLLFDTETRELIKSFDVGEYWVNDVAFGPKGELALAGTNDGVILLDLEKLSVSRAYEYDYTRDYNMRQEEEAPGVVRYWSDGHETSSHTLTEATLDELAEGFTIASVVGVEFGPTGEWFVTVDEENVAVRWDFATGKKLSTYYGREFGVAERQGHMSCVFLPKTCVAVSPDGKQVLTGCPYGPMSHMISRETGKKNGLEFASALILWGTESGGPLQRPPRSMHGGVEGIAMAADGRGLALSRGNDVVVLSSDADAPTQILRTGGVMDLAFASDDRSTDLLLAYYHGICRWDGTTTAEVADVRGLSWSDWTGAVRLDKRRGDRYITTPALDRVEMFTIGKNAPDWTYAPPGKRGKDLEGRDSISSNDMGPLIFARMSPDGTKVLVGSHPQGEHVSRMSSEYIKGECSLTLLNTQDGSVLEELSRENEVYADAAFSPNGRYLLLRKSPLRTEEYPRCWTTTLWDMKEKRELASFDEDEGGWWCDPVFTPDSRRFLFGRNLRDTATGEAIWKLGDAADGPAGDLFRQLAREGFYTAVMSPDGRMLITGHRHGRIAVWSTETGAPIAMLGFTLGESDWYVIGADGHYDGTPESLSTLYVDSPSGCQPLPDALPEFHEPGLAGCLLPFVGPVGETQ